MRARDRAARSVAARVLKLRRFRKARKIGVYIARNGELDPAPLLTSCRRLGKRIYLPVLHPFFPGRLKFCPLRDNDRLLPNRYGIPQPRLSGLCLRNNRQLDLVLMPLVAFDQQGNRLGMGGGYYDRSFAYRRQSKRHHPLLIGLAYEFQHTQVLPHQSWDIPLDAVVTEQRVYRFNPFVK